MERRDSYMSLPVAFLNNASEKCFEEVRIEDYLKALSATGKPPAPCPAQPTAPASRAVLGLPPLFQPHSIEDPPTPTTISDIPAAQVFTPSRIADETFYSITANVKYDGFSFEELRLQAYEKGHKTAPGTIQMVPFLPSTVPSSLATGRTSTGDAGETLISITTTPAYSGHSFEELRVAYLRAGRELTSAEITGPSADVPGLISPVVPATPQQPPSLFSSTTPGSGFSRSPAVRPF